MSLVNKNFIELYIRAKSAETGPPLGTVLGNLGINAVKFCKEFNEFTKELPSYFLLKVKILIFEDRSYSFSILSPTTGFILMFVKLKINMDFTLKIKKGVKNTISLKNVVQLAKFKFPNLALHESIPVIIGSVILVI